MLRSIRLSLRFVLPLALALILLAYMVVPLVDGLTLRWAVRDMDIRSQWIGNTLQEPLTELIQKNERGRVNALLLRATKDERLLAVGVCDQNEKLLYRTAAFPADLSCKEPDKSGQRAAAFDQSASGTGAFCHQPP